jgi:predicted transcriptional regulator of viral defense system
MNFQSFRNELREFPIFSIRDISKLPEKVYYHRLVEWQKKGYMVRLGKNLFAFSERQIEEHLLMLTANKMYSPSYISLEMALNFYNLIPETSFTFTSVSARKTTEFQTTYGHYSYKKIKKMMMFGYDLLKYDDFIVRFAYPEKAIIDFLYLNPRFDDINEIHELRINPDEFKRIMNMKKMDAYLKYINSEALIRRFQKLHKWVLDND